jgi:hypothetical protein
MFEENENLVFRKTLRQVVKDLESINNIPLEDFQDTVLDQFDRYSYEGEDEVVGFDRWCDISQDGNYEVELKVNHEDAYLFTIYVTTKSGMLSVTNVL